MDHLRLMESIIENSPAVVFRWAVHEGWPVVYVSRNIEQLGYTQKEMVSGEVSWPGITHPDDVPRLEEEVSGYLTSGTESWSQTYRIRQKDGAYRWVRDWNLLLRDGEGAPVAIQGIVIDITREKAEEEHRERVQADLQKALAQVISGFVPICCECKAIRDESGKWAPVEIFIAERSPVHFTHGYCPACAERLLREVKGKS